MWEIEIRVEIYGCEDVVVRFGLGLGVFVLG